SECIERPLDVVRYLLELESNSGEQLGIDQANIPAYFKTIFASEGNVNQIPSLNDVSCVYGIPQYTLVRFRSMIQNTGFGHEVFVSSYEMVNRDGIKQKKFHKYSDEIVLKDENLNDVLESLNSPCNEFSERQLFYCTSVPGETQLRLKSETNIEDIVSSTANINLNDEKANNELKESSSKYPFPKENHMAAVIKIYEKEDSFKVTDVVEFIGVLNYPRKATNDANESQCDEFNVLDENTASCYSPSVHVIFYRKLHPTGNPLISTTNLSVSPNDAELIRSAMVQYIASAFGGDYLVAEFVLLQLLSRIHLRQNGFALGKLALNISNASTCNTVVNGNSNNDLSLEHDNLFAKRISSVLASLLPKYHDLPLTLSTLNELFYFPRSNNELDSGVLQVSQGTWFLIDETVLKEGKLCDTGVRNLKALNDILDHQKLNYTFPFNNYEFDTDIGIIILSNAKSFLNHDCNIPLIQKTESITILDIPEDTLNQFRKYISILRWTDFNIPENISNYIQTDYVTQRQKASRNGIPLISQEDLMLLLNLSRLVGLSFGSSELTKELWDHTKKLDEARRDRIYHKV
ncbi:9649_t:CDS:10, partial [Funneliformis geosporum]